MKISPVEIAVAGQYAENVFFGKPCGLMDQTACAYGGFVAIDFADTADPIAEKVDFDFAKAGYALVITDTHGDHANLTPEYAAIREEMQSVAAVFGKKVLRECSREDVLQNAGRLRETAAGAKRAYLRFAELDTDRQAKLVRPLALGLLEGDLRKKAEQHLVKAVRNYRYRVGTGFLSTPFILPVLTEAGESETAYKMLLNEEKPGWLGEVADGATTVWENWEGNLSQNHYSPGAVCQWLFDTVCGIRQDGENHFVIAPVPGPGLTCAEASYRSLYGEVRSRWSIKDGKTVYEFTVPANCTAELRLPDGTTQNAGAGSFVREVL